MFTKLKYCWIMATCARVCGCDGHDENGRRTIRDDKIFGVKVVCTTLDNYRNQPIGNGWKIFCSHNRIHDDTEDGSGSSTCSECIITDCRKGNNVQKRNRWGFILCRKGHQCYTVNWRTISTRKYLQHTSSSWLHRASAVSKYCFVQLMH